MNEENDIELPKRIDEIPSSHEPDDSIVSNEIVVNDPRTEEENGQIIIPENVTSNDLHSPEIPVTTSGAETTNIFDQSGDINNAPAENITPESAFEPISDLDVSNNLANDESFQEEVYPLNTPENPAIDDEINTPVSQPNLETSPVEQTPFIEEPIENEPLEKKLVVEDSIKKEKSKGNPIVGFIALLLILATILTAFYYFVKMDYIKLPDEIKNKIPFFTTTTTKPVNPNEEDLGLISVVGNYLETEPIICPDVSTELSLKADATFSYSKLFLNSESNNCDSVEVTGNYTASEGNLKLIPTDNPEEIISATYRKTQASIEISILAEDGKTIILFDVN